MVGVGEAPQDMHRTFRARQTRDAPRLCANVERDGRLEPGDLASCVVSRECREVQLRAYHKMRPLRVDLILHTLQSSGPYVSPAHPILLTPRTCYT